ncbi:uncharacterized protein LOC120350224 [Nilaparvata lugens]|uniref:uncharacterized protein LOC120350224 n=1 Tax=Nilaparvata lugens TaxID=108931 RepID=UPI00193E8E17|nr:uncharacterized protein LOC120350224 [Nilaparvata lugens]
MVVAESAEQMEEMMKELLKASKTIGLHLNAQKTRLMTNSEKIRVEIDCGILDYVEDYEYLGQVISFVNRSVKEIKHRIDKGWKKYWALKRIFKGNYSNNLKGKALSMCVYPTILYGSQTWALTEYLDRRLETTQTKILRSILRMRLSVRSRNTDILRRVRVKYLQREAHILK